MRVLGFMSGTSLDAVDMAILETNGETIQGFGPAGERKLSHETALWYLKPPKPPRPGRAERRSLSSSLRRLRLWRRSIWRPRASSSPPTG